LRVWLTQDAPQATDACVAKLLESGQWEKFEAEIQAIAGSQAPQLAVAWFVATCFTCTASGPLLIVRQVSRAPQQVVSFAVQLGKLLVPGSLQPCDNTAGPAAASVCCCESGGCETKNASRVAFVRAGTGIKKVPVLDLEKNRRARQPQLRGAGPELLHALQSVTALTCFLLDQRALPPLPDVTRLVEGIVREVHDQALAPAPAFEVESNLVAFFIRMSLVLRAAAMSLPDLIAAHWNDPVATLGVTLKSKTKETDMWDAAKWVMTWAWPLLDPSAQCGYQCLCVLADWAGRGAADEKVARCKGSRTLLRKELSDHRYSKHLERQMEAGEREMAREQHAVFAQLAQLEGMPVGDGAHKRKQERDEEEEEQREAPPTKRQRTSAEERKAEFAEQQAAFDRQEAQDAKTDGRLERNALETKLTRQYMGQHVSERDSRYYEAKDLLTPKGRNPVFSEEKRLEMQAELAALLTKKTLAKFETRHEVQDVARWVAKRFEEKDLVWADERTLLVRRDIVDDSVGGEELVLQCVDRVCA